MSSMEWPERPARDAAVSAAPLGVSWILPPAALRAVYGPLDPDSQEVRITLDRSIVVELPHGPPNAPTGRHLTIRVRLAPTGDEADALDDPPTWTATTAGWRVALWVLA